MAVKKPTRSLRLRRLAAELRRLRQAADLTREQVSDATGINDTTLYRIETARTRPQKRTLTALLNHYGVAKENQPELIALTKDRREPGWLAMYPEGLPEEYTNYIGFEAEAKLVRNYESLFVPGLLQTEDYARAVITGVWPSAAEQQVEDRVKARLQRQRLLYKEEPLKLRAIIDEAVLHRTVGGPAVMRKQLRHLVEMMRLPNVNLHVIRFEAGAHPGMLGSFCLVEFPDPADPAVVYIDSMAGDLFLEGDIEVARYSHIADDLLAVAISSQESKDLIISTAEKLPDD